MLTNLGLPTVRTSLKTVGKTVDKVYVPMQYL